MKKGRPSKRSIAAKASRGKWSTRAPALTPGQVIGCLQVINNSLRGGKNRIVLVLDLISGECFEARADRIKRGIKTSSGWKEETTRKENYKYLKSKEAAMRERDPYDYIDPALIKRAMSQRDTDIDAGSGRPIGELRAVSPTKITGRLAVGVLFSSTEEGFIATGEYFNEFHQMPPEDFDLKAYWARKQAEARAAYEARKKKPPSPPHTSQSTLRSS